MRAPSGRGCFFVELAQAAGDDTCRLADACAQILDVGAARAQREPRPAVAVLVERAGQDDAGFDAELGQQPVEVFGAVAESVNGHDHRQLVVEADVALNDFEVGQARGFAPASLMTHSVVRDGGGFGLGGRFGRRVRFGSCGRRRSGWGRACVRRGRGLVAGEEESECEGQRRSRGFHRFTLA